MKPRLIPEWRKVLNRAWSVKFSLLAGLLGAAEVALPIFSDSIPRGLFASASALVALLTPLTRVLAQKDDS